jgi:hypothetical protein
MDNSWQKKWDGRCRPPQGRYVTASPHVALSVLLSHEHGSSTLDDVASTERQHCGR